MTEGQVSEEEPGRRAVIGVDSVRSREELQLRKGQQWLCIIIIPKPVSSSRKPPVGKCRQYRNFKAPKDWKR